MTTKTEGGPTFPFEQVTRRVNGMTVEWVNHKGMTLRQYAAIHLCVPDSGTDWLDDMIRQGMRDDLAAKAMQAAATNPTGADGFTFEERSEWAYEQADAMLARREKQE